MAGLFANPSGGLVPLIVANPLNTGLGAGTFGGGQTAGFSVRQVLAASVASQGYSLISGDNYQLGQVQPFITQNQYQSLGETVSQQVQQVGAATAAGFISQNTPLTPAFSSPIVTTAGLATQAALSSIGIPDQIVSLLPTAEYSNRNYNLNEVTFTLLPSNTGPQSAPLPQTKPTIPLDVMYSSKNNFGSKLSIDALKQTLAFAGPATGSSTKSFGYGSKAPAFYKAPADASQFIRPNS